MAKRFFRLGSLAALACALVMLVGQPVRAEDNSASPVGHWRTIDDDSGEARSIIDITEKDGILYGKVIKIFSTANDQSDHICHSCDGERKDQPIMGMQILWGFHQDGDEWDDGSILDPDSGDVYSCTMKLMDQGQKLKVHGYIALPILGRTQVWLREKS